MVYDPVGGPYAEAALRSLAWEGRYLVVGFAAGEIPKLPLNLVLLKGCDVRGVFWGTWLAREGAAHRANMADFSPGARPGGSPPTCMRSIRSRGARRAHALSDRRDGEAGAPPVSYSYSSSIPRASAARAASRCSGRICAATMRIAVASTAASSAKPSAGSMSGTRSYGSTK